MYIMYIKLKFVALISLLYLTEKKNNYSEIVNRYCIQGYLCPV